MNSALKKYYAILLIALLFIFFVFTDGTFKNNKVLYIISFFFASLGAIVEVYKRYQKKENGK